jgi:hypothetical protein
VKDKIIPIDSKFSLENNDLFRDISKKTAELLGYKYPEDVDKNFTDFTQRLYANSFLD